MTESTYRTGQVARLLNTSSHHIRKLCESGLIEAEVSEGKHWRVLASEVDRLKQQGLPPIPQEVQIPPVSSKPLVRRPSPRSAGGPPGRTVDEAEEIGEEHEAVQQERANLAIAETSLKRRRVELERENVEDAFRDRLRRQADVEDAARKRAEQQQCELARKTWLETWLKYALSIVPDDCLPEYRLRAYQAVEKLLADLNSQQSQEIVKRLVHASVQTSIQPYIRGKEITSAVEAAVLELPLLLRESRGEPSAWQLRAKQLAQAAIAKSGNGCDAPELRVIAKNAVRALVVECEFEQVRNRLAADHVLLFHATEDEERRAKEAVQKALNAVPVSAGKDALKAARLSALEPFEVEMRRRDELRHGKLLVEISLSRVAAWLDENWEFDSYTQRVEAEEDFKRRLRNVTSRRLADGRLQAADITEFIDDWLEQQELDGEGEDD